MPVDIVGRNRGTALKCAAANNRTEVVRCLLEKGANIDQKDFNGWTALHHAFHGNSPDVIKMLLQLGATRDIKSRYGETPIDVARGLTHEEAVRLLEQ